MQDWGPAVLRAAVGVVFAAHGLQKLLPSFGGGPEATAVYFGSIGLEPALPLAWFVGVVELAGGLALILGVFTLYVSIALIIDMAVALWKVHLPNGFFINWVFTPGVGHGYELHLVLIAALVSLCLTGAGAFSVDRRWLQSAEAEALGRARLRSRKV
jgi:putative oxidoreductase